MKKLVTLLSLTVFTFAFGLNSAQAEPISIVDLEPKAQIEEAARLLNGTAWALQLHPMSGGKNAKPIEDMLKFYERKLNSERLTDDGYNDSNISLSVQENGTIVWETMQGGDGKQPVFWRGEFKENRFSGVFSSTKKDGSVEAYSFRGESVAAPAEEVIEEVVEEVVAPVEEIVEEVTEAVQDELPAIPGE